jgi:hypothetical protein
MIKNGFGAIPSLARSMRVFKKYTIYVFTSWLISMFIVFFVNLLFDFVRISVTDYLYHMVGFVILMIGFYILKELLMVLVNAFIDIFSYVSYLKLPK